MEVLQVIQLGSWDESIPEPMQAQAMESLEIGKVLFLPSLCFPILPEEAGLLTPRFAAGKAKNISFDIHSGRLRGTVADGADSLRLKTLLSRFAAQTLSLVDRMLPRYQSALEKGRTSFRPVEIQGRVSSYRKDDTRLHVDAFPATPVQDRRILRVFSNVNPNAEDRVWRVGEPFEAMARVFLPQARNQFWGEPDILRMLRITKSRRTPYDHIMLELHNRMKADMKYQSAVEQREMRFPAGSTWLTFTDQVSHAAMSGQHCLEQTLYLPVDAMADSSRSPLRILEHLSGSRLV